MFPCQQEFHKTGGRANVYICVLPHAIHRLACPRLGYKVNQNMLILDSSFAKIHVANIASKQLD